MGVTWLLGGLNRALCLEYQGGPVSHRMNLRLQLPERKVQHERGSKRKWGSIWPWRECLVSEIRVLKRRLEKDRLKPKKKEKQDPRGSKEKEVSQYPSCFFFQYHTQLGVPYHILVDTKFINFFAKVTLDLVQSMRDYPYANSILYILCNLYNWL